MIHASLFTGFGGFDFAADAMGWETLVQVEKNPFCRYILNYYWSKAHLYEDIKSTDFRPYRGRIDILTGGFPCQPYSLAGARKGKEDDRHLFPEMLRAIREIEPPIVVGENVPGFVSWNKGLVFEEAQSEMEAEGYEVQSFVLPACGIDAPHIRSRVFLIAYSDRFRRRRKRRETYRQKEGKTLGQILLSQSAGYGQEYDAANPNGYRSTEGQQVGSSGQLDEKDQTWGNASNTYGSRRKELLHECFTDRQKYATRFLAEPWTSWPTQSPLCSRDDVFPAGLDGITFPGWRNESTTGFGNAVAPALVLKIFRAIDQFLKATQ